MAQSGQCISQDKYVYDLGKIAKPWVFTISFTEPVMHFILRTAIGIYALIALSVICLDFNTCLHSAANSSEICRYFLLGSAFEFK